MSFLKRILLRDMAGLLIGKRRKCITKAERAKRNKRKRMAIESRRRNRK